MSQSYAYLRVSPMIEDIDSRIEALQQFREGLVVHLEKRVRGFVPLCERPVYQQLEQKLKKDDELILWWIDELGRDFEVCLSNLLPLLRRGIIIRTVNQHLELRQDDMVTDAVIKMMQGYAESGRHRRIFAAEMGRKAIKDDPEQWKRKFRGRRCNKAKHRLIAQKLFEGKTLQQVADETDTSLSTVKRVKSKLKAHDELGHLRGKGTHSYSHKDDELNWSENEEREKSEGTE
ncbi:recombinase family protein [Vibrio salinus]|uniref:recombinase family protein n=1 Tax=Vibrio salinus TaxID=2899784 RepID=UPI001E3E5D5E|nr:recombinase family protein [Vibrio salinus]MCE0496185.1 recombinase family protein [Vibrio salinus]